MQQRPTQVYLTGARVGGIYANLMVQANVIDAAHHSGVHKLLLLGSCCIYPGMAAQPVEDDASLRGAPEVAIWGSGTPRREFLYVDDMAVASVFLMNLPLQAYQARTSPMQSHLNVGSGKDVTIAELALAVGQAVGFSGNITLDTSKPDGAPRKWMDSGRLNALGWQAQVDLAAGLQAAYADFVQSHPV